MTTNEDVIKAQFDAEKICRELSISEAVTGNNFFEEAKKYIEFAVKIIVVLGKYFIKDNKIHAPSLMYFWKYINLITELYVLFKDFKNETK